MDLYTENTYSSLWLFFICLLTNINFKLRLRDKLRFRQD